MAAILQQWVKTTSGWFTFRSQPALIELRDDGRFVMIAVDSATK